MNQMPQRIRTHALEEESRKFFENLLPTTWVPTPRPKDYGIDMDVEIFDDTGAATGLVFLVQLKGTDAPCIPKNLSIVARRSTLNYWHSLELPVLIVKYFSREGCLFARWADTFDSYYVACQQKSVSIPLAEKDRWVETTPDRIRKDIALFRQVRSGGLSEPIGIAIVRHGRTLNGLRGSSVETAIRHALNCYTHSLRIVSPGAGEHVANIELWDEKTSVSFGGITGFIVDFNHDTKRGPTPAAYADDVMICLARALDTVGKSILALNILKRHANNSVLLEIPQIAIYVSWRFANAREFRCLSDLSRSLLYSDKLGASAVLSLIIYLAHAAGLLDDENRELEAILAKWVEVKEQTSMVAECKYNLGRYYLTCGRHTEAFGLLKEAARERPSYVNRPYFSRDLGALFFEKRSYFLSTKWYANAMCLSGDENRDEIQPLYSDALFYSGRFGDAAECWEDYFNRNKQTYQFEWCLKLDFVRLLLKQFSAGTCKRSSHEASMLALEDKQLTDEANRSNFLRALELDPLCSLAWYNLATASCRMGDSLTGFRGYLHSALIERADLEAWAYSVLLGFSSQDVPLLLQIHTCGAAYNIHGESLVIHVETVVDEQPDGFPKDEFMEQFGKVIRSLPKPQPKSQSRPFELRVTGDGEDYETFSIVL